MDSNATHFTIRPYTPGDEHQINDTFNHVFGTKRSLKEWKWKFQHQSNILLSLSEEETIIGHYAAIIDNFQYEGASFLCGQSIDTFSQNMPGAVQRKLIQKIVFKFFELYGNPNHISIMYGFPGTRILKLGQLKFDYGRGLPVPFWEKRIQVQKANTRIRLPHKFSSAKMDHLWSKAQHRYPVSIIRDGQWIRKRYLTRPQHNYQLLWVKQKGNYTCLAVVVKKNKALEVVDLIWDGKQEKHLISLEQQITHTAAKLGLDKVSMWLSGDELVGKVLSNLTWELKEEPHQLHLVVKSFNSKIDREHALDQFYLTKGCTDII